VEAKLANPDYLIEVWWWPPSTDAGVVTW
jgi:hypothetical protein